MCVATGRQRDGLVQQQHRTKHVQPIQHQQPVYDAAAADTAAAAAAAAATAAAADDATATAATAAADVATAAAAATCNSPSRFWGRHGTGLEYG